MGNITKMELQNEHIAEEMVEHLILEKVGGLPNHGHAKGIRLKKKIKRKRKNYNFEFYSIFTIIIMLEIFYLWNYFFEKNPKLDSLFIF